MKQKLLYAVILCLTLGLAPFSPEPHIVGKIKWLMGGANGMGAIDWFDLFLHGIPWLFLIYVLIDIAITKVAD
ncbi:MAG: hypothetical protein CMP59_00670 [Flavobacteriales bacterium]|nr:hypothetical protein [Flavobacteriales bacterium]